MMICSLLVFLGTFKTHEEAIDHYNKTRAQNEKALTIRSQRRYVKFFCGFLHYKLRERNNDEEKMTFFELALRKHNYLSFNRVFEDMRNEVVDFHSICMGPFPYKQNFDNFIVSYMKNYTVKPIFNFQETQQRLDVEESESQQLKQVLEWKSCQNEKGATEWYLILNLHRIDQKVFGDFKVEFGSSSAKFYFWLNVSAILYNKELKKRDDKSQGTQISFDEF